MVLETNLQNLLGDKEGETFELVYRGHSEVDRHYTKPMLPWIIAEIKNQHKLQQVTVGIKDGVFTVRDKKTKNFIMNHTINQIHKCVMEQADHRCFLYTLRPPGIEDSKESPDDLPKPLNIPFHKNYECHLFQALTEQEVRSFFSCLRNQPKEAKIKETISPLASLADLSVHVESQFFEVLFVGRVKVSHAKVPATFIDEALQAFKSRERKRQREPSGENRQQSSPNRLMSFQMEGSGYSVPNIILNTPSHSELLTDIKNMNVTSEGEFKKAKALSKVHFQLGSSFEEQSEKKPDANRTPDIKVSAIDKENVGMTKYSRESTPELGLPELPIKRERCFSGDEKKLEATMPAIQRIRTGSFGSGFNRQQSLRTGEEEMQRLRYDFNRTMLFHVGHREIQLINPELKSVQLNKSFKEIAGCCQGVKCGDHFGFICREMSGESVVYVGYIFRCEKNSVTDEIMQTLSASFVAMHEAHEKDRQEHLMCDFCPLKWLSHLCADVEGLQAMKAHSTIMKKVTTLPDDDRELIVAKYEGVETQDVAQKNNVLMMLLRTHFEYKQLNHNHPSMGQGLVREFSIGKNIESSITKAKKSLTSSFNQFLRREDKKDELKEIVRVDERKLSPSRETTGRRSASPEPVKRVSPPKKCVLQGISDSPLKPHRPRSSTVTGVSGDAMRKEVLAKKAIQKCAPPIKIPQKISPSPLILPPKKPEPEEEDVQPSSTSFRHAILQKVVTGSPADSTRRSSTGDGNDVPQMRRSGKELIILWKRIIFQQMILARFEKEFQRMRMVDHEAAMQRARLNYEEDPLPGEAMQAWEFILSRSHAAFDASMLTVGVKQGIPKMIRGEIWSLLVSQHNRTLPKNNPNRPQFYNAPYERVLKELTSQQHAILIDIGRTFPSHPYFTQTLGSGQLSLFNLLKAYSIVDKEVGYCQGLCFVGGIILLHVEEEESFELMKHIMYEKGLRKQYRHDLDNLQIQMYQLSRLVRDKFIDLHYHLEDNEVTPQLYAAPWFLTIFASQFPINFVVRVFDLVFLYGIEAIFSVCMVLLKVHEQELLQRSGFEKIMHYLKNVVPNIKTHQLNQFFAEVCECVLTRELTEYEIEYKVLQEEQFVSPQQLTDIRKMKEATKNLKRQNLDLLEQLHNSNRQKQELENNVQSLQQSQHHLEVRVRWLELERNNMKDLIHLLYSRIPIETAADIPLNLERYLPLKRSSPVDLSRHNQSSDIKNLESKPQELLSILKESSNTRSNTLDPSELQSYLRNVK